MEIPITEIKALVEYVKDDLETDRAIPPEWEGIAEKVEAWLQSSGLTKRAADDGDSCPVCGTWWRGKDACDECGHIRHRR
jgi:hypothetical protein